MATALDVCVEAYRQLNLGQPLSSFSQPDYPYSLAADLLKKVLRQLNRMNKHAHLDISQSININGRNTLSIYEFNPVLNPRRILSIWLEAQTPRIQLTLMSYDDYQNNYNVTTPGQPSAWTFYGSKLLLNTTADKDYGLVIYFQEQIPLPTLATDVLVWPDADLDILIDGVTAQLAFSIKLQDAGDRYSEWQNSVKKYFSAQYKGVPLQMPRRF